MLVLAHTQSFAQLREDISQEIEVFEQEYPFRRPRRHNHLFELISDPFFCDHFKAARKFFDGPSRRDLDIEIEFHGKTNRSHQTKRVFAETLLGVTNRANDPFLQIFLAAEGIDNERSSTTMPAPLLAEAERERIHGEIPSGKIFLDRFRELHFVGMPLIGIFPFDAIGRNLNCFYFSFFLLFRFHDHRAKVVLINTVVK